MNQAAFLACCILASAAVSATEPMVTDRPDFTESSSAVPRGVLQIEGGGTHVELEEGSESSLGELLVRWGVADGWEVRFGVGGYAWFDDPGGDGSGFEAFGIGAKVDLAESSRALAGAEIALIFGAETPTGSGDVNAGEWTPEAVVSLGWDLARPFSAGANLGVARPAGGDERFTSVWLSGVLGVEVSDSVGVFFELYGFNRQRVSGPSTPTVQTGVAWGLTDDLQLDARVARRLSNEGPELLVGLGASVRF